jgi:hypothetical protein
VAVSNLVQYFMGYREVVIGNLLQYSVEDMEWEFETWFNIPWRIWNGNTKID